MKIGDKFIVDNNELFQNEIVYVWDDWAANKKYFKLRKLNYDYGKYHVEYFDVIHKETLKSDWGETVYIPLTPALEVFFGL